MKHAILAPLALAIGTLALAGCDNGPARQASAAAPKQDAPEGIAITDGRLVLPAVKGNPAAVYFTVHNDAPDAQTISGAAVKGAKSAMIHQMTMTNGVASMTMVSQIAVPAMGALAFKPGGLHLMVMDLDDSLAKGGTTVVSLTFAGGDTATFPVEILAAGDAR